MCININKRYKFYFYIIIFNYGRNRWNTLNTIKRINIRSKFDLIKLKLRGVREQSALRNLNPSSALIKHRRSLKIVGTFASRRLKGDDG